LSFLVEKYRNDQWGQTRLKIMIELSRLGVKDIGFGITMSDRNAEDMIELYQLAKMMKLEFATAAVHNAFYFNKMDNTFEKPDVAIAELRKLIKELLKSHRAKDWFRAYFNYGLINYIKGNPRLLPCEMSKDSFFLDPFGRMLPCNVINEEMGNLRDNSFSEIWTSSQAENVRAKAANCGKNCWMMGSVSQQMKKNITVPGKWLLKHKFLGQDIDEA
jgi:MoaA/NifB/PqqE/SkfB family radical SAM enzyme